MSRLFAVVGAFVALAGCAPGEYSPIALTAFYLPQAECKLPADDDEPSLRGALEVVSSATNPPTFNLGFRVLSNQGGPAGALEVGGTVLQPADLDRAEIDTMVVRLTTTPVLKLPEYSVGLAARFTDGEVPIGYPNIISEAAGVILQGIDRPYEMKANIEFLGRMSRSGAVISSGPVAFPISVTPYEGTCTRLGEGHLCSPAGTIRADGIRVPACCDTGGGLGCN